MAETEVSESPGITPIMSPETVSVTAKERSPSLKELLRGQLRGRLTPVILTAGSIGTAAALLISLWNQAESDTNAAVTTPTETPTTAAESFTTVPQTEEPTIIDDRQPALTPVETQAPSPSPEPPVTETATPVPTQSKESPKQTATSSRQETKVGTTSFEQVRTEVHQLPDSREKTQALENLKKLITVDSKVSALKSASQLRTEPDGTPTLLALTNKKYGKLPLVFQEFNPEDRIHFIRDARQLNQILQTLQNQSPEQTAVSLSTLSQEFFNQSNPEGRRRAAYLQENLPSIVEFDLSQTKDPKAQQVAENLKDFLIRNGLDGKIRVRIILADQITSMGNAAGTFSDMGEIPEIQLGAPFSENTLAGELGHLFNPNDNTLLFSENPEEIIDLMILSEQALSDPKVGRNYPEIVELFSPGTVKSLLPIHYKNWLYTSDVDKLNPPNSPVFHGFKEFDAQFNTSLDQELQRAMENLRYITVKDFSNGEKELLDKVAQLSEWDRTFVEIFRKKAGEFNTIGQVSELSIPHLRRMIMVNALFEGDQRVVKLFENLKPEERQRILSSILNFLESADSELLSNYIEAVLTGKIPPNNPYGELLNEFRNSGSQLTSNPIR